jgi:hypothetical protein
VALLGVDDPEPVFFGGTNGEERLFMRIGEVVYAA